MSNKKPQRPIVLREPNPSPPPAKNPDPRPLEPDEEQKDDEEFEDDEDKLDFEPLEIYDDWFSDAKDLDKQVPEEREETDIEIEEEDKWRSEEEGEGSIDSELSLEELSSKTESDQTEILNIPYDSESSYFFMFGVSSSGKTVILSGLYYNLLAHRIGDNLEALNDHEHDHQKRGTVLLDDLLEKVPDGMFPKSTTTLRAESQKIPRQINFRFGPKDRKKPGFKFTMMDMSGEDLMQVKVKSDYDNERLQPGIEAFLKLPDKNLAFICVYPAQSEMKDARLSSYMKAFFDELDRIGHQNTPMLFIVSKWDLVEDRYESIEEFLKERDPIIWNKINESERNITMLKFSIGKVDLEQNKYKYDPTYSNQLFKWMYETQIGISLDEDLTSESLFSALMKKLFGKKNK